MLRVLLIWLAGVLVIGLAGPASAGKPGQEPGGSAPPAWTLQLSVSSYELPDTLGTVGLDYAVAGKPFQVTVTSLYDSNTEDSTPGTATPLSENADTKVALTVPASVSGPLDNLAIPAGESSVSFTDLKSDVAESGVVVEAKTVSGPVKTSGSKAFDILITDASIKTDETTTSIGGETGVYAGCNATAANPVCADLLRPARTPFAANGWLSQGYCLPGVCKDTYIQALVAFTNSAGAASQTGDATDPATLVMKCDKTLCGQGGINKQKLVVQLRPTDKPAEAPACGAKGVVTGELPYCVDYVQSTRDNAGDTFLYLLFTEDAKVRFP